LVNREKYMASNTAERELVFQAAEELNACGQRPTIRAIREQLGHGSNTTIHKYLTQWKKLQEEKLQEKIENSLETKLTDLQQQLKQQQRQNQQLTKELLDVECKLVANEDQFKKLTIEHNDQSFLYNELSLKLEATSTLNQTITAERDSSIAQVLQQQQQLITQFQQDIKEINQECLAKVSDINIKNQDAWLAEKVKNKELTTTISELNEKLYKLERKIQEERNKNAPLRNKIAMQEELISKQMGNLIEEKL
jgi:hypothetical protein